MEKPRRFLIAHFHPVELYPPCLNMIETFVLNDFLGVLVSSSQAEPRRNYDLGSQVRSVRIRSYSIPPSRVASVRSDLDFALNVRLELISGDFDIFLLYEAVGFYLAIPRFWSKKLFVALHFHEYRSKKESKKSSRFERLADNWSASNLRRANWVSQATELRSEAYSKEHRVQVNTLHNFPSFRPVGKMRYRRDIGQTQIRIVFLGTLDLDHPVLEKMRECVSYSKSMEMTLIGSIKDDKIPSSWMSPQFHFAGRIHYNEILEKLNEFDIGVIHYAAHSENFRLGVPNKFFEYQYAQLPVLYDVSMQGIEHFSKSNHYWGFCSEAIDFLGLSLGSLVSRIEDLNNKGRGWQGLKDSVIVTSNDENSKLIAAANKWYAK